MAAIIFDFDGTIADSFETAIQIFYELTGRSQPLPSEEIERLRGMPLRQVTKELHIHFWKMPFLLMRGRRRMKQVIGQLEPFAGMPEVIRKLHAEGHELFVLSSNTVQNVRVFLHNHDLHTYFLEMYGGVGLFGKAPALRRLLREHTLERENAIYVGDEVRDVQAAQSLGLRVIAVGWGFTRAEALKALCPTALANQPNDLVAIFEEL